VHNVSFGLDLAALQMQFAVREITLTIHVIRDEDPCDRTCIH